MHIQKHYTLRATLTAGPNLDPNLIQDVVEVGTILQELSGVKADRIGSKSCRHPYHSNILYSRSLKGI